MATTAALTLALALTPSVSAAKPKPHLIMALTDDVSGSQSCSAALRHPEAEPRCRVLAGTAGLELPGLPQSRNHQPNPGQAGSGGCPPRVTLYARPPKGLALALTAGRAGAAGRAVTDLTGPLQTPTSTVPRPAALSSPGDSRTTSRPLAATSSRPRSRRVSTWATQ